MSPLSPRKRRLSGGLRALLIAATLLLTQTATAGEIGKDKKFGIGVEFAYGPGLSLKFNPSPGHALQFGLYAFDYGQYRAYSAAHNRYYYGYATGYSGFLAHADYLNTFGALVRSGLFDLPWYWGAGLDLGLGAGSAAFAVHGNLGVAMQFKPLPLDVFLEWTPRLWVIDFVQFHPIDFNAGLRVWF